MIQYNFPWDRPGNPHARIELPGLSPEEALLVFDILQKIADEIWKTYEDGILEILVDCMEEVPDEKDNPSWIESTQQPNRFRDNTDK